MKKEYQKHIIDERTSNIENKDIAFCGEVITEWAFISVSHYVASRQCNDRLLACPECKQIIIDLMLSA